MKQRKIYRGMKSVSASVLASAILFGGIGVLPAAQAEETQTAQQASAPASFAYLNDPARTKLIDLNALRLISTYPAESAGSFSIEYYKMLELEQEAYAAVMDPTTSQAHLQAIARTYKLRLDDYMDYYLPRDWVEDYFYAVRVSLLRGSSTGNPSPEVKLILDVIDRTLAQAESGANPTDQDYRDAYVDIYAAYLLESNTMNPAMSPTESQEFAQRRVGYIRQELDRNLQKALAAGSTEDYSVPLGNFEQAVSAFEQLNGSASQKIVEFAVGNVQLEAENAIKAFDPYVPQRPFREEEELKSWVEGLKANLDLPKGTDPGEYPASAFGALRRAINEAERALEKGGSRIDFGIALEKAFDAYYAFRNSINS